MTDSLGKTLASLALLKANLDADGSDIIDMIVPLVAFAGSSANLRTGFTTTDLKSSVLSELGLVLPERAVDLVLRRLQRQGVATKVARRYSVSTWPIDHHDVEERRSQLIRRACDILENLRAFVKQRYKVDWSSEQTRDALDSYLDTYSIDCIKAHAAASPVPVHGRSPRNSHFLVSSYAHTVSTSDSQRFGLLMDVVKGRMLANAVLGEDLVDQKQNFAGTSMFLDAPLVLRAVGLSGAEPERLVKDVIDLGKQAGASWNVFDHTLEEADAILREVQRRLGSSNGGHGDVYFHARAAGYTSSDVALLRSRLNGLLDDRKISIQPTPKYSHTLQIDEKALEEEWKAVGLSHINPSALRRDINSIRSIYVLRKDGRPRKLEDCRAALVTSNSGLARGAFNYGKRHESSREVSPAITEYGLANLLWLKWPIQAGSIPKHVLAASCQAALSPSAKLWQAFLAEVAKLEKLGELTPEQHAFLRYETRARDELMELTFGDEDVLNADAVTKILSSYEADLTRPHQVELAAEKCRHAATENELRLAQEGRQQLRSRLELLVSKQTDLRRRVSCWARKAGQFVSYICSLIGAGLILVGMLWQFPGAEGLTLWIPRGLLILIGAGTAIFSFFNLFTGLALRTPIVWLRERVEHGVYRIISRRFGLDVATTEVPQLSAVEDDGAQQNGQVT